MINYEQIKLSELNDSISRLQDNETMHRKLYVKWINAGYFIDASEEWIEAEKFRAKAECLINIRNIIASRLREERH